MTAMCRPFACAAMLGLLATACSRGTPASTDPPAVATTSAPAPPAVPAPDASTARVAYKVDGGADAWHGSGIVCDFTRPFALKGGGLTIHFTPASKDGGTYAYDGTLEGFKVRGGEAYSVEWIGTAPVKMKGWGVGTVDTPLGPRSDNGIEYYTIERATEPCPAS